MHNTIKKRDFEKVQNIISFAPGSVNAVCPCGVSHFAAAVLTGNVPIVNLMISSKADVNASLQTGLLTLEGNPEDPVWPLHIACVKKMYNMVKALVEAGADVNTRLPLDGSTPMHINANHDVATDNIIADGKNRIHESQRIQTLLLSCRANIDAQNVNGQTPLHVAIRNGTPAMQCFLIRNGAHLNVFDNEKQNALIYAVSHGSSSTTAMLLANRCGIPPYHVPLVCMAASRNGWSSVLQMLRNGANINETDEQGNNAIHYALTAVDGSDNCCRETHIIDKLIKRGCNPCLANKAGMTPLGVVTTPGENYKPSHAEYILLEYVIDSMYRFVYGPTPASAKEMAALMNTSWRYEDVELLFKIKSGLPSYTRTANESLLQDLHRIRNALISDKNAKDLLGCEPPAKNAKQRRIERKADELRCITARVAYLQALFRRSLTPPFGHAHSKECTVCFEVCNIATMAVLGPCGHRAVCADCEPRINMVCPSCRQRVLCFVRKIYD